MDKITSDVRRQQWLDIIQACNASGLTKKAWCEQNGINIKSFYKHCRSDDDNRGADKKLDFGHKHGVCTDTFVAINKRVICNQSVSKADGFVNNAWIKLHIVKGLQRLADC